MKILQIAAPATPTNAVFQRDVLGPTEVEAVHIWALIEEDGETRVAGLISSGDELIPVDDDLEFSGYQREETPA